VILILPATVAAGVYQISQLFYTFFASRLGEARSPTSSTPTA
jgi:peptidoglycan biosynthesis protein MviN/MurJ (putative lipid II flippase)